MRVLRLEIENFRSYSAWNLDVHPGITVVSGANGRGKTNLLEALHVAATGLSFRTRTDEGLVRWGEPALALRLHCSGDRGPHYQALIWHRTEGRRVRVQEKEGRLLSALLGHVPVVAMTPGDIALVQGAPDLRRRFLDTLLCQWRPAAVDVLRRYNRIVLQRNRWLRDAPEPGRGETLDVLSEQMADWGGRFLDLRHQLLEAFAPAAARVHHTLSQGAEVLELRYGSSLEAGSPGDAKALRAALEQRRPAEITRRITLVGPHKDDLLLQWGGHGFREYGSQGQCRCAALSLRLGASALLQEDRAHPPLLLLDDIFAELDPARRAAVGTLVREAGQVFCATPNGADIPFAGDAEIRL